MAGRFETLYYEDVKGTYLGPGDDTSVPEGSFVQVSRFPHELTTTYLQLKEGGGSSLLARFNSSYSPALMLALVRPNLKERFLQLLRYGFFAKKYDPKMAVFLAAETCERCMNSLAHRHGVSWGYREGSKEWHRAGTTCSRCVSD